MSSWLIEIGASLIESYIFYSLAETFFEKKVDWWIKFVSIFVLVGIAASLNSIQLVSYYNVIITTGSMVVAIMIELRLPFRYSLPYTLFYMLILQLVDSVLISVCALVLAQPDFMTYVMQAGKVRSIFLIVDKLIYLCLYFAIKKWMTQNMDFIRPKYLLILSVGGLGGGFFLTEQIWEQINIDIALSWILIVLVIVLIIAVMYLHFAKQHNEETLEFTNMRNELLQNNYNNLKSLYEENSKLFHDFKHHIQVMEELAERDNIQELKEYISGFELQNHFIGDEFYTEDSIVNFVLNNKIEEGKRQGIRIEAEIDYPAKAGICANDMTTVLANLFDNAIESCKRMRSENGTWIRIRIRRNQNMLLIKMENSCVDRPVFKGKHFVTAKANKVFHGWGLKSVQSAVEKYHGVVECEYNDENKCFCAVVNLFMHQCL